MRLPQTIQNLKFNQDLQDLFLEKLNACQDSLEKCQAPARTTSASSFSMVKILSRSKKVFLEKILI